METGQLILPTGSSLAGRYEIAGVIGLGGMAVVYEAIQLDLGRPVAVKVLSQRLAADEAFRRRFRREAEHAAALDHPNIVTIHDFGEAEDRPYLAMSLIRGRTLADELANGPLTGKRTIEVLEALGAALDHAHGRRVLHRDVKPQNVLLDDSGGIFLADFGISKGIGGESVTATGGLLGTVRYAAPEQIRGAAIGPAADLYSLAVLAYECLTGSGPYLATSDLRLLAAHLDEPPLAFDDGRARGRANEALVAALAKNPGDRPGTSTSFVGRLRDAMDAEPASLTSTPAFKQRRPELVHVDVDDWLQNESGGDTADLPAISDAVVPSATTNQRKRLARTILRRWPVGLAVLSFALPAVLLSTPPPDTRQLKLGRDGPSLRIAGEAMVSPLAAETWGKLIPGFKPTGLVDGAGRDSEETVLTESAGQTVPLAPTKFVASRLVSVAGGTVRRFDTGQAIIGVGQSDRGAVLFGCRYRRSGTVRRCDTELVTLSVSAGQLRADPVADVASELARAFRMVARSSRRAALSTQDATLRRSRAKAMSKASARAASVVAALSTRRTFDGEVMATKAALSKMAGGYEAIAEAARQRSPSRDQAGRDEVRDGTRDLEAALRSLAARGYEVGDQT